MHGLSKLSYDCNLACGLRCHSRFDDCDCFKVTGVSEIKNANCMFGILVLGSSNVVKLLHTLNRLCTMPFLWLWCEFKGDNENVFCRPSVQVCWKLWYGIYSDTINVICQTLRNGTSHWALPVHTTWSDLEHISRWPQCWTVLTEFFFLLNLTQISWNCRFEKKVK